jgi:hypothetical protein
VPVRGSPTARIRIGFLGSRERLGGPSGHIVRAILPSLC